MDPQTKPKNEWALLDDLDEAPDLTQPGDVIATDGESSELAANEDDNRSLASVPFRPNFADGEVELDDFDENSASL